MHVSNYTIFTLALATMSNRLLYLCVSITLFAPIPNPSLVLSSVALRPGRNEQNIS
jgi:hypothetical protein